MGDDRTGPYLGPLSQPAGDGRFAPGDLLAGRYRIVAHLRKGGMGEVYRADDLTLGQPVALNFLPPRFAADPDRLARFRKEVATARRVSHPNACRVYDIGDHNGQPFLAMEFIDGEDLAALLRRVGRLPEEKGVEIARQLCAALAAVHGQGLLHRDLKPQNVMLDGHGQVRLTDFGLAVEASKATDVYSGTPAYQAPEVLAGQEVTARSDLFALGLVLYEVFTGKRAFPATDRDELARAYHSGIPAKPSSHVSSLNPAVERVILRCLEQKAKERPQSAYEVLGGLPGGDPLAAALAAGEIPSPKLVADAGEVGTTSPRRAALLVGLIAVGLVLVAYFNDFTALFRVVPQTKPPDELAREARQLLADRGYPERPADAVYYFLLDRDYLDYIRHTNPSPARWDRLRTDWLATYHFLYREAREPLAPGLVNSISPGHPYLVSPTNPPATRPGMATVQLDGQGRLLEMVVIPDAPGEVGNANIPADWAPLLTAAGLRADELEDAELRWVPLTPCDRRAAWKGKFPGQPDLAFYVEAAAFQGKPVFFRVGGDWVPRDGVPEPQSAWLHPLALLYGLCACMALLALRNLWLRRGDRRGAVTLGGVMVVAAMATWLLGGHHPGTIVGEMVGFESAVGAAALNGLLVGLCYLAVEPAVRRRWPWRLTAWTRALAGRLRDPLVGRDLLIGLLGGVSFVLLDQASVAVPALLQVAGSRPITMGYLPTPGLLLMQLPFNAASFALFIFALVFLFTLVLRRDWLVWGGLVVLPIVLGVISMVTTDSPSILGAAWDIGLGMLFVALYAFVTARFGLLASAALFITALLVESTPLTWDATAWYFWHGLIGPAVVLVLAAYGFFTATAGQRLFAKGFFGDESTCANPPLES